MSMLLYPLFVVFELAFDWIIARLLVNWWAPLFANADGWLPGWLAWFQTFDNSLDAGWKVQGNYGTYLADGTVPTGFTRYCYRVMWLYRNSAYGFDYWLLGVAFIPSKWRVVRYDTSATGNLTFIALGSFGEFNVHATRFGLRFKLGWKAWNYFEPISGDWKTAPWGPEWRAPFVFSISRA